MTTWICGVCGYRHEGDEAPETCPVCGVGADMFTAEDGAPNTAGEDTSAPATAASWRCAVCGYEHEGSAPPASCPVCGAGADAFEAAGEPAPGGASGFDGHLVIIGAGIAGVSAAEAAAGQAPDCRITLINSEGEAPYQRINLTRYLADDVARGELQLHDNDWYAEHGITLRSLHVDAIDRAARSLHTDGEAIAYDRLLLATGAQPFVPPIPGAELPGVQSLRSLADAEQLLAESAEGDPVVIVGGGVLGLECAGALAGRGRRVTVLERAGWLMTRQLDAGGGRRLGAFLEQQDIAIRYDTGVSGITGTDGRLAVTLADGTELPAVRVVLSTGVRPDTALAEAAGLPCEGGIAVDDRLRTDDEVIWAAGDCCRHRDRSYGLWTAAQFQGRIAGANAVGGETDFHGLEPSVQLKVLDLPVVGIGRIDEALDGPREERDGVYRRLCFDGERLVGAVFVGDAKGMPAIAKAIEDGRRCTGRGSVDEVIDSLG